MLVGMFLGVIAVAIAVFSAATKSRPRLIRLRARAGRLRRRQI